MNCLFALQIFIGFLITIIVAYINLLDDKEDAKLYLLFVAFGIIVLNYINDIKHFFVFVVFPFLKNIVNDILSFFSGLNKITPFKKGFFSNKNFKISYITETIFMILIILFLITWFIDMYYDFWNIIVSVVITGGIFIGLIWGNVFISNLLCSHFTKYFEIISLLINIIVYLIIGFLIYVLGAFCECLFDCRHPKKIKKGMRPKKIKKGKSNSYSSQAEKITKEKWERYLNKEDV